MFPIAQNCVERVVLVPDESIQQAQEALWNVLRIAAEPGGAAAFAALLSHRYAPKAGERVGVLVCGGNMAAVKFQSAYSTAQPDENEQIGKERRRTSNQVDSFDRCVVSSFCWLAYPQGR